MAESLREPYHLGFCWCLVYNQITKSRELWPVCLSYGPDISNYCERGRVASNF